MKKFVNIIKQSNLISILFSILLSFSIAFTFYNYISEGTILSKRYALFSAAIFAFSLIGLLIFRVAPFLKRVLSSERIILIIILVVFISIDVNGILSVPKAFFLLENQEVEFSVNSDPSIEERDECLFEMLSVYDGNQWSYGEAINHKLTESNVENNQANNLCPKREIFWQGKPYQEMTIIFQKQPDGGYVKVRYGEQAYAIDLESYDFQEYQLNIPINHNKFNLFLVEKLPRIITLFFTISVLFILLGLIDKNVNRFFVNYLSNINNSDQLIIIFLSFSFIALVFDFLFLEQIINRLGLFLILFLIHIGIGYLLFHKPGIIKKVRSFK